MCKILIFLFINRLVHGTTCDKNKKTPVKSSKAFYRSVLQTSTFDQKKKQHHKFSFVDVVILTSVPYYQRQLFVNKTKI